MPLIRLPFRALWHAQDALRRLLNRWLYCSLDEHRRPNPKARCLDCGEGAP